MIYQENLSYLENNLRKRNTFRDDPNLIDLSSNDYLNLSRHPLVIQAAKQSLDTYGLGSTGSRLLSGNKDLFEKFEDDIATKKKTDKAMIFSSGFQANMTVLSALVDPKVTKKKSTLFFDRLNHASLYESFSLKNVSLERYRHLDLTDLETRLKKHDGIKWVVTETLFGMDGDMPNMAELVSLCEKYNANLYLDEAHATGVLGVDGYGLSTTVNLKNINHVVIMGTLSKALGSSGGFIACDKVVHEYLMSTCKGWIYSTAPSPCSIAGAHAAWNLLPSLKEEREKILSLGSFFREQFPSSSRSHIVPIMVGDEKKALELKDKIKKEGYLVSAIRPPSVPIGTSRIRIAFNATHLNHDFSILRDILVNYT